jgi:hypothetical protein
MTQNIISLGSTCSIAYQLQQLNRRQCAYPFDWIRTDSLSDINQAIRNNFQEFVKVTEITKSDKFPIFDPDISFFPNENKDESMIMRNKYNMQFYHDFPKNFDLDQIQKKYQKRIDRFSDIIKVSSKIYFVRDEIKANKISINQIEEFLEIIKNINPCLEIKFILIIHNPKNKKLNILDYKNNQVEIINDVNDYGDWIRPNVNWSNVLGNTF